MCISNTGPEGRLRPKPSLSPLFLSVSHPQPIHCVYLQNILRTQHFFITSTAITLSLEKVRSIVIISYLVLFPPLHPPTPPLTLHTLPLFHTTPRVILLKHKSDGVPSLLKWFSARCRVRAKVFTTSYKCPCVPPVIFSDFSS